MSDFRLIAKNPPGFLHPGIAIAASRAGALGILDLTLNPAPERARPALLDLHRYGRGQCGIRISTLFDDLDGEFLESLPDGLSTLIVETESEETVHQLVELSAQKGLELLVEAIDLDSAERAARAGAAGIIVKGHEAGGKIGEETALVLLQRLAADLEVPFYVQGGISPHAAAACSVGGAAGVVLDWQLALAREAELPEAWRRLMARLDGGETVAVGGDLGDFFRVSALPGSSALSEIKAREARLADEDLPAAERIGRWRDHLRDRVQAGEADERLVFLGQEASMAAGLAERHRTVGGILKAVGDAVVNHRRDAAALRPLAAHSSLARSHGTRFPIAQGPMTRVSDNPAFALEVAEAGGLPFLALSVLRENAVRTLLEETQHLLGDRSWGVGILGFVPLELRTEQLQVVREIRPRYALIAGGRPDQALELEEEGISTYLHVPSPGLLEMFLNQGSRKFVFEGRECGGHVGPRTSFVLWSSMIDLLLRRLTDTELADCQVLFAGGIHDARSSAIVATMAAPLAARGVGIGALMGTAYLFTREAVETGAIVPGFQKAALSCRRTVLLESAPGHATRATDSPFSQTFMKMRRELTGRGVDGDEIQRTLEELNLGRLRIASKGIERVDAEAESGGQPQYLQIDEQEQSDKGLYMIGQVAALRHEPCTMEELHRDVSEHGSGLLEPATSTQDRSRFGKRSERPCDVAIIGMSCLLPKAQSIRAYWSNILHKVDAVTEVPRDRWDWRDYYDSDRKARDRVYSKWGGFLDDIVFDPLEYGMPPTTLASIEPLQLLTLVVATAAMEDSGYIDRPFDRERASVILGAGGGVSDLGVAYSFRSSLPMLTGDSPAGLMASLPEWTEDSFPGILMNVAAGRIANRLDFGGLNCTMDAACAASLAALYLAVHELESGASDLVVTGGADTAQNPFMYLCFSKTQALSPTGRCRTFDQSADGIAISEGIAALVLKRLADAERDGDRIYAVIKGIGGSADGREKGLTAPRPAGQAKALRRAYAKAGFSAATVGLIEAHGTGTVAGDQAEVETLKTVFQEEGAALQSCALGSVKSMIGHTKCTAGVAGLIKIAMALHHKVLPPTMHVTEPNREARFHESPFYVNTELRPWIQPSRSAPRRAGVSAFGFGGTNFHVAVEEYTEAIPGVDVQAVADDWPAELFLLRADGPSGLLEEIEICGAALASGTVPSLADFSASVWRRARERRHAERSLAIVAISLDDLRAKLETSRSTLAGERNGEASSEIFFYDEPLAAAGRLAFLYSGQGSQYPSMLSELASYFVEVRESFELADRVLEGRFPQPLSRYIFPPIAFSPEDRRRQTVELTATRIAQPALGATEIGLTRLLERLGVSPDVTAGHSYGEYTALYAAGVFDAETLLRVSEMRGRVIEEEAERCLGTMAAVTANPAAVNEALGGMSDVWIANLNSPRQTVISGTEEAVDEAVARLQHAGLDARRFNVACAFHSPLIAPAAERLAAALAKEAEFKEPQREVYSNTSARPYPKTADRIAEHLVQHLVSPVRFSDEITAMYDAGVRVFVEVGPKGVLSGLTRTILTDHPAAVLAVDPSPGSGMRAFLQLLGALAAHGHELDLDRLYEGRTLETRDLVEISRSRHATELPPAAWLVNGGRARPAAEPEARAAIDAVPAPSLTSRDRPRIEADRAPSPALQTVSDVLAPPTTMETSVTPAMSAAASSVTVGSDDLSTIVLQHQRLMARFLETQQTIMKAYLEGSPESARAASHAAAGEAYPVLQQGLPADLHVPRSEAWPIAVPASLPPMAEAPTEAPPAAIAVPAPPRLSPEEITAVLVSVVSERTGYPPQMLKLDDNITADLGIDSIKWVEILGAFQKAVPAALGEGLQTRMEALVSARTLAAVSGLTAEIAAGLEPAGSAAASAAAVAESAAALPGPEEITAVLVSVVSERTGYPPQMLKLDDNITADLGIDSIKWVEILGAFQKAVPAALGEGLQTRMESLVSARTLAAVSGLTAEIAAGLEPAGSAAKADVKARSEGDSGPAETPTGQTEHVPCFVVSATEIPLDEPATEPFRSPKVLLVFDDEGGLGSFLCDRLGERGQPWVRVRRHAGVTRFDDRLWGVDPADGGQIRELVESIRAAHGPLAGVLFLSPLEAPTAAEIELDPAAWKLRIDREVKALFRIAQAVAPDLAELGEGERACLLAATAMGGRFGVDPRSAGTIFPGQAGIAGLVKTLALEWPAVRCKALDLDLTQPVESGHSPSSPSSTPPIPRSRSVIRRIGAGARGLG
jgi:acyl transferase domain-containing protein/NAD(P)H-dependent flavin oxidoreductase YrpB (nitropropane dioxygenase family)